MRKTILVLAASVAMGMAQMSIDALAASRSHGGMSGMHGSGGGSARASIGGPSAAFRAPSTTGTIRSATMSRSAGFSGNNWSGGGRHRHHRFHRSFVFGAPFAAYTAYAAYDSCYQPHRVWTPWGWRWDRVYVCGYPYDYDY